MSLLNLKSKNTLVALGLVLFSVVSVYLTGGQLKAIYAHYREMFGPVFWLFLLLAAVLLSSMGQILTGCYSREPSLDGLRLVESAGPAAGLLGTVLALMNGFGSLNLSGENLDAAINGIVHTIAVSLSTTAFGLILSLLAWAFRNCVAPLFLRKWQERAERLAARPALTKPMEVCDATPD